jgi:GntR family transcriptional regulator
VPVPARGPLLVSAVQSAPPLPLYHRVYLLLRQQILEGAWTGGEPMPGEHMLAARHAVSRITVRNALRRLAAEGLVSRRRGSGTFVQPAVAGRADGLRGLMESLHVMGQRTQVRLLSFELVDAPPEVARLLDLPVAAPVQKSVRVRLSKDMPFSHLTAWVPGDVGARYTRAQLARRPLLSLLEEAGFPPARAEQVISAKLADDRVASLLQVAPGSALLWTRRRVWDNGGRPIEAIDALYRPDVYDYQVSMVRQGAQWSQSSADPPT